ncbi:MAG: hypothetical protein ABEH43_03780 [Flavobacteriales bacterium]
MAFYQLIKEQDIPASANQVWDFIATPRNLKRITPDEMGFKIITDYVPEKMYEGMKVGYEVFPFRGIKSKWLTEITFIQEGKYFVDEQRIGPYRLWHHQHILEEISEGTRMRDVITYAIPFGVLGSLMNKLIIRKKLEDIFEYRRKAMEKEFGKIKKS